MFWYGNGNGLSGWGYGLMGFGMLVFWVLLIGVFVMVLRHSRCPREHGGVQPSSLTADQSPAERFARGEIDQQEHMERQAALRAHVR